MAKLDLKDNIEQLYLCTWAQSYKNVSVAMLLYSKINQTLQSHVTFKLKGLD